jgi:putative DNA primase/helicase
MWHSDTTNAHDGQGDSVSLTSLADLPIWVYWKQVMRNGNATKVPRNPNNRGHDAKSDDPATWAVRSKAEIGAKIVAKKGKGGVGVMFADLGDGTSLIGIDLDACLSKTGVLAPHAAEIVQRFATAYPEISPSGNGVKLYFRIRTVHMPIVRKALGRTQDGKTAHGKSWSPGKGKEVALHLSNRYFAVTGIGYGQDANICELVATNDDLGVIGLAPLLWLIFEGGPDWKRGKPAERDKSGSGALFRLAGYIKRAGGTREDFEEAIPDDDAASAHVAKEGDRAINRAWEKQPEPAEKDSTLDGFELNEDGVIRAFTARHADELKFDHDAGKWFQYDGNCWRRDNTKLAHHFARESSLAMAEGEEDGALVRALKRVPTWEAVERGARTVREFSVTSDVWNLGKMLLGTPGGTVELVTGELRPGRPEDFISKVTAVAPIPLDKFKPERDCPRWLKFLDEALAGDAGAIRLFQQWGGYSLTGEIKEHALLFPYGPGGSGKSTAVETIGKLLGEYGTPVAMEVLTASKYDRHPTEIAALRGARMVWASETEKGRAWAENRIKLLTGGDTLKARFMRQDEFTFLPEFKLTVFGNNRPALRDVDGAVKRRFIILPFDHPPEQKDTDLPEKLKVEWPGILSWLIVGCLDWQENGLVRPAVVEEATNAYFDEQDTFKQWMEDCCEVGPQFADTTEELWRSWQSYAHGLGEDPGSKMRTFPETLSQRGFVSAKKVGPTRNRGFKGLRVRADAKGDDERFI